MKKTLKKIGKEFNDVYEKIKDHPNANNFVNKLRREMNSKFSKESGTSLHDFSLSGGKEFDKMLKTINKYY